MEAAQRDAVSAENALYRARVAGLKKRYSSNLLFTLVGVRCNVVERVLCGAVIGCPVRVLMCCGYFIGMSNTLTRKEFRYQI